MQGTRSAGIALGVLRGGLSLVEEVRAQSLQSVATDLDSPTFVTSWPGTSLVLAIAERGSAKVVRYPVGAIGPGGPPPPTVILDLSTEAFIPNGANMEFIGLTAIEFHPQFLDDRTKRLIYVRYNEKLTNNMTRTFIVSYKIPSGFFEADKTTREELYCLDTVDTAHGAGQIHFDTVSDSTQMYFAVGDDLAGSSTCTELEVIQSDSNDFGKLFVMDVDDPTPTPTMLAKGMRNPFGISVDPGDALGNGLGDVWIANTGPDCSGDIFR